LIKVIAKNQEMLLSFALAASCMCGDAWNKIDWSPTSPFRKNRILQELKRAYPVVRTNAQSKILLCVGMVFEHLDAFSEAIDYYDKSLSGLLGEDKKNASQRWVRCHLKRYQELKSKNNIGGSNEALRKAEDGFYTAGIKRGEEDTIPQMPQPVDANWLLQDHIEKAHQAIQAASATTVSPVSKVSDTPLSGISPAALSASAALTAVPALNTTVISGSYSKVSVAGLDLEYFSGKKLRILAPDGVSADYNFSRGQLKSTDDDVIGLDGLSMPSHGLVAKKLSDTSVQISFSALGINVSFGV
jgi:hypothetical protein